MDTKFSNTYDAMIPELKIDAVKAALFSTFGTTEYYNVIRLTKGLSNALVFRIDVLGKPYLLKIARTDALADPSLYYYACMTSVAEVGIVPRIWYTNIADQISITDFIETTTFPLNDAKIKLAEVIHKLHSVPPFSKTIHSLDTTNRFIKKLQAEKILPEDATKELFNLFEKISSVYPHNPEDMVASHNDLKPENLLYDGCNVWLTDWEAAFTNDRYSDLAILANFVIADATDETLFLSTYFNRPVTEYELTRFYLMRQIMHMSYFTVFMVIVAKGNPIDFKNIKKEDFKDFHNRMWNGEIDLSKDSVRLEYAMVHLNQLQSNLQTDRFRDSLEILSKGNGF
jgi:thiamine kinase-like enzyme